MCTVVQAIYSVITVEHIQASIFNRRYLRWLWWYSDNSIRAILQSWCQIQRTSASLRNVNCGPGHIQCNYSTAYSCVNVQLNVSALALEICRQFTVRYTANFVPSIAHFLHFTHCELWYRTYSMYLQLHILRLQYSNKRICAAIGDMSTIQWALYCKHGAKYSAGPSVCAMWTVVPDIYNIFTAPHIQGSIFNKT
jgi:hypothetical protein